MEILNSLNDVEIYCKENYKNIDWIDFKEFSNIINKFSEESKEIENEIYDLENINEVDLIKEYKDIHIHKFFRYVPAFLHKHDFFEIIYVYSGISRNYLDGKEIILNKGDILIIPPFVKHATFCPRKEDISLNILVRKSTVDMVFFELLKFNKILSDFFGKVVYSKAHTTYLIFHTKEDEKIKNILIDMLKEEEKCLKYESTVLNGLLMIFFGYLMRNYEDTMEISKDFNEKFEKFDEVLEYIHKNYNKVTLDDLSEKFKFNKYYLSKIIKSYTGKNFVNIVQSLKMRKARELLIYTNLPIEDISNAIGYNSTSTFIRTFKEIYKISPSQYRKNKEDLFKLVFFIYKYKIILNYRLVINKHQRFLINHRLQLWQLLYFVYYKQNHLYQLYLQESN